MNGFNDLNPAIAKLVENILRFKRVDLTVIHFSTANIMFTSIVIIKHSNN